MDSSNRRAIVVIGSINVDMVVKTPHLPKPGETVTGKEFFTAAGGKGANQAVAAARLGGEVLMLARVGGDDFGDAAVENLRAEGIDTRRVTRAEGLPTGVALISVDERGENQIVVAPGANDSLGPDFIESAFADVREASLILLQLEIPLESVQQVLRLARQKHCRVILDPAPARELPRSMLERIWLLTPNEIEAETLSGVKVDDADTARAAAEKLLAAGAENLAVTLGSRGVLLANEHFNEVIPAPKVDAVDSTAAGDCFNGALASALAQGHGLPECVRFGCAAAAKSVTRRGAQSSLPFARELQDWPMAANVDGNNPGRV